MTNTPPEKVRCLMHDIALIVSALSAQAKTNDVDELQQRGLAALDAFDAALQGEHVATQERQHAVYAASALLDEAALAAIEPEQRESWMANPLQVTRFANYQGGERVFEQIDAELSHSTPSQWLLSTWQVVLALGYQGKHSGDNGTIALHELQDRIAGLLARPLPEETPAVISAATQRPSMVHWRSFSPVLWALGCCAAAGVTYVVLQSILKVSIAMLAQG